MNDAPTKEQAIEIVNLYAGSHQISEEIDTQLARLSALVLTAKPVGFDLIDAMKIVTRTAYLIGIDVDKCQSQSERESLRETLQEYCDKYDNGCFSDGQLQFWIEHTWLPFVRKLLCEITPRNCQWTFDEDGFYQTACGGAFELNAGTLSENEMHFCYRCGKTIEETKSVEEVESE